MGNPRLVAGVYRTMLRGAMVLSVALSAMGQGVVTDPVQNAVNASWQARTAGQFSEAAAKREEARGLLDSVPADSPAYIPVVQQLSQLYQSCGMGTKAVAVLQQAVDRASKLGDAHPTRIAALEAMADYWIQDRSLLKAAGYLETAVSALDTAPAVAPARNAGLAGRSRILSINGVVSSMAPGGDDSVLYTRLADLYRQLGRPEAADAMRAKVRERLKNNPYALASFLESEGRLDEAAAVIQKQVDGAGGDARQTAQALQRLSELYMRQERFDEAAASLQRAIAAAESSPQPTAAGGLPWMRQTLAQLLNRAGKTEAADQVYQQLLAANTGQRDGWQKVQVVTTYANYLANTKRQDQAESTLKQYLSDHPEMDAQQQGMVLMALSSAAAAGEHPERAREYSQSAMAKMKTPQPAAPPERARIADEIARATSAANSKRLEEGFNLALLAMDHAAQANDREQIVWGVASVAGALARAKEVGKAMQLFDALFALAASWSDYTLQVSADAAQSYARFLMAVPERAADVPQAIERYRAAVLAMRGPDTGLLEHVLRLQVEFARRTGNRAAEMRAAEDLLTFEEGHNGGTSELYLNALESVSGVYEASGDTTRSLQVERKKVAIADLVYRPMDERRAHIRMSAAMVMARQQQFDEAERLAGEAIAIGQTMRPKLNEEFAEQLQTIRRMKAAAAPGDGKWFLRVGGAAASGK